MAVRSQPSRRERKKAERRSAIYETALELFTEHGFSHVSIEEITEAVDVSKGTFFNYFPTKDAVLVEYRRQIYDEMHEYSLQLDGESGLELFRKYFRKLARLIQREGQRYRMLHLMSDARTQICDEEPHLYDRVFDHYRRFIEIAVDGGELREDTDAELMAEFIRDLWQGNLHEWVVQRRSKSLEGSMRKKLDFFFELVAVG